MHHKKRSGSHRTAEACYRIRAKRALTKTIKRKQNGLDTLPSVRFQLIPLFIRAHKMHTCIDIAFEHQPFLPNYAPDSPVNTHRFSAYIARNAEVTSLLIKAVELWKMASALTPKPTGSRGRSQSTGGT